ncbi:MAG: CHAT domain-containing protein [Pyrinomonadaceae bacterium]
MKLTDPQSEMRRYLLGTLPADDLPSIEERILTDDSFAEELLACEDELIDDYLDGALTEGESESFIKHFLSTAERQEKLGFAEALRKYAATNSAAAAPQSSLRSWLRSFFASPLVPALSLLLILALGFGAWRVFFYKSDLSRGLLALKTAYASSPTEARVTVFDASPRGQTRGSNAPRVNEDAHRVAERFLLAAVQDAPDAESHHAIGCLRLAEGNFDEAIREFEAALKLAPNVAQVHSDLGAAYMERAKAEESDQTSGRSTEDFGRGSGEIDRALALDASLPSALYNRALCHQYMGLAQRAEDDWRAYLQKDSTSAWAAEARRNLAALEERDQRTSFNQGSASESFLAAFRAGDDEAVWKIYTRSHQSSGNAVTNALLDAILAGVADGAESLRALTYLGELERRRVGDAYVSDLARAYSSVSSQRRARLSAARELRKEGYELFKQARLGDGMQRLVRAGEAFNAAGDTPEALSADFAVAHAATVEPDVEKARALFARVAPACEARGYTWLCAQVLSERAHLSLNLNRYSAALADAAEGLRLSEQVQDTSGTIDSLVQVATIRRLLNDTDGSLTLLRRAIEEARAGGAAPMVNWGLYTAISFNFNLLHLDRAALDYQREALRLALDSKMPLYVSRSYEYLGETCGRLQLDDEAFDDLRRAYEEGEKVSGQPLGRNMMANASLKLGDLYRLASDEAHAVASYDESIRLYDQLNFSHYAYAAHKGKFLAYLAAHDDALAAQELSVLLPLFENYREQITEERRRNVFFDREQDVYDLAIDFAGTRLGDAQLAYSYAESSRARTLLDEMRGGGEVSEGDGETDVRTTHSAPLTPSEIRDALPADAQILQYAVLGDKLLVWVVNDSGVEMISHPINPQTLSEQIEIVRQQLAGGAAADDEALKTSLRGLYDVLIKPVEARLDRDKLLCIVPDKALSYLPFAALLSPESGKYLVADYRLTVSPSSAVFIESTKSAAERAGRVALTDERLLAVGNPSFDRSAYKLADLTDAAREATGVADFYRSPRILLDRQAREGAVRIELERADVAHFAAHYVIDPRSSLNSKLLLAKDTGVESHHGRSEGGGLEPRDIYQLDLSRARLVVLSACQTGVERQYGGEGAISIARPFLAKRVPLVVASLWPVASDATADLMIAFHRFRREQKLVTAEALRQAQLKMIASGDARLSRPSNWASFVVIGGRTDF